MNKTLLAAVLWAAICLNASAEEVKPEEEQTESIETTEVVEKEEENTETEDESESELPKKVERKGFYLDDIMFGVGNLTQFVNKIQTNESGSKNTFSFLPYIQISGRIPLIKNLNFNPEFTFTIPEKSNDGIITKFTYLVIGNLAYDWNRWVFLGGAGLSFTRLSADGGSKELNNGDSSDFFPIPKGSKTSSNIILHLGARYQFIKNFSAKAGLHFYNIEDGDERALSYTIGITYHLDDLIRASGVRK